MLQRTGTEAAMKKTIITVVGKDTVGIIAGELEQLGESIGVIIKCQKEEIFNQMHRI